MRQLKTYTPTPFMAKDSTYDRTKADRAVATPRYGGTKKTAFNDSWTYDFHSQNYGGAGWYRARASSSKGAHSAAFHCGQNNCVQGNLLTYWDNPANSGNRMVGTPLTVANLNSGRAGTF